MHTLYFTFLFIGINSFARLSLRQLQPQLFNIAYVPISMPSINNKYTYMYIKKTHFEFAFLFSNSQDFQIGIVDQEWRQICIHDVRHIIKCTAPVSINVTNAIFIVYAVFSVYFAKQSRLVAKYINYIVVTEMPLKGKFFSRTYRTFKYERFSTSYYKYKL